MEKYLYLAVFDPANTDEIRNLLRPGEYCEVRDGVWLIHSEVTTSDGLSQRLGIGENRQGLVISVRFYAGWVEDSVIEALDRWRRNG